eukprot:5841891-Pleurochrysis_carterae.AAC.1
MEEHTYLLVNINENVTAPRPRAPAQHRATMATPASGGTEQMFYFTTTPIADILESERVV